MLEEYRNQKLLALKAQAFIEKFETDIEWLAKKQARDKYSDFTFNPRHDEFSINSSIQYRLEAVVASYNESDLTDGTITLTLHFVYDTKSKKKLNSNQLKKLHTVLKEMASRNRPPYGISSISEGVELWKSLEYSIKPENYS